MSYEEITNCSNPLYPSFERILIDSFPHEERRDVDKLKLIVSENQYFHPMVVIERDKVIGIFSYWRFESFVYVEHFATQRELRGKGFGQKILVDILSREQLPIVLEVEPAETNPLAQRRINFYKRCGLEMCGQNYLQPPYRKGDDMLPLILMSTNLNFLDSNFTDIKTQIYKEVYSFSPNH